MDFPQWLQSRLTAHRFPVGPIDGEIGPITTAAIAAFQKARGLEVTGTATQTTVQHLKLPSSTVMPEVLAQIPDRDATPERETFQPSKRVWPRQSEVPAFFGAVGKNQVTIDVPFEMWLSWSKSTPVRRISLHLQVAKSAEKVLQRVAGIYSAEERKALGLDLFGGSLNVRRKRGGKTYSMHAWGIALDFDPERNQLHTHRPEARLSHADAVPFWIEWESEGWLSLGRARDFDWMHVQAARL